MNEENLKQKIHEYQEQDNSGYEDNKSYDTDLDNKKRILEYELKEIDSLIKKLPRLTGEYNSKSVTGRIKDTGKNLAKILGFIPGSFCLPTYMRKYVLSHQPILSTETYWALGTLSSSVIGCVVGGASYFCGGGEGMAVGIGAAGIAIGFVTNFISDAYETERERYQRSENEDK